MEAAMNHLISHLTQSMGNPIRRMGRCLPSAVLLLAAVSVTATPLEPEIGMEEEIGVDDERGADAEIDVDDEIGDTPLNVPDADPRIEIDDIDPDTVELRGEPLRRAVEAVLRELPGVNTEGVDVQVHGGTVTLRGMVDSWTGVAAAGNVVRKVEGVRRVTNLLRAPLSSGQSDAEIKAAIENAFNRDGLLENNTIIVVVTDGYVTLTGDVDSIATKKRAVYRARVGGVEDIDASRLNIIR